MSFFNSLCSLCSLYKPLSLRFFLFLFSAAAVLCMQGGVAFPASRTITQNVYSQINLGQRGVYSPFQAGDTLTIDSDVLVYVQEHPNQLIYSSIISPILKNAWNIVNNGTIIFSGEKNTGNGILNESVIMNFINNGSVSAIGQHSGYGFFASSTSSTVSVTNTSKAKIYGGAGGIVIMSNVGSQGKVVIKNAGIIAANGNSLGAIQFSGVGNISVVNTGTINGCGNFSTIRCSPGRKNIAISFQNSHPIGNAYNQLTLGKKSAVYGKIVGTGQDSLTLSEYGELSSDIIGFASVNVAGAAVDPSSSQTQDATWVYSNGVLGDLTDTNATALTIKSGVFQVGDGTLAQQKNALQGVVAANITIDGGGYLAGGYPIDTISGSYMAPNIHGDISNNGGVLSAGFLGYSSLSTQKTLGVFNIDGSYTSKSMPQNGGGSLSRVLIKFTTAVVPIETNPAPVAFKADRFHFTGFQHTVDFSRTAFALKFLHPENTPLLRGGSFVFMDAEPGVKLIVSGNLTDLFSDYFTTSGGVSAKSFPAGGGSHSTVVNGHVEFKAKNKNMIFNVDGLTDNQNKIATTLSNEYNSFIEQERSVFDDNGNVIRRPKVATGPIVDFLNNVLSSSSAQEQSENLDGQIYVQVDQAIQNAGNAYADSFNKHLDTEQSCWIEKVCSWGQGAFEDNTIHSGQSGIYGYTDKVADMTVGIDAKVSDRVKIGVLGGYSYHTISSKGIKQKADVALYTFGLYGRMVFKRDDAGFGQGLYVNGGVLFQEALGNAVRSLALDHQSTTYGVRGNIKARQFTVSSELGYVYNVSNSLQVVPFFRINYGILQRSSIAESGVSIAPLDKYSLDVHSRKATQLRFNIGAYVSKDLFTSQINGPLTLKAGMSMVYYAKKPVSSFKESIVGQSVPTLSGVALANSFLSLHVSASYPVAKNLSASIFYDQSVGGRDLYTSMGVGIHVGW